MTKLADIEREALRTDLPSFAPGDTLKVMVRVREGEAGGVSPGAAARFHA